MEDPADIAFFPPEPDNADLPRLVHKAQLTRTIPHVNLTGNRNSLWVLDYHFKDAGKYSLDANTWRKREKGTAHLYAPGTLYWEKSSMEDVPFQETYLLFRTGGMRELDKIVSSRQGIARFMDPSRLLHAAFEDIFRMIPGRNLRWRIEGIFYHILYLLTSARYVSGRNWLIVPEAIELQESFSQQVSRFIRKNAFAPLALSEIADSVNVSRSTLTHRYRKETGMTPMDYLNTCRLDVARAMILRGEKLKVVADQTGYCDEYHLSKAFKHHFGLSPRRYIQSVSSRQELPAKP